MQPRAPDIRASCSNTSSASVPIPSGRGIAVPGSGQAAVALAEWFADVDATDVSAEQIANALGHDRVHYSVQAAERTTFPAAAIHIGDRSTSASLV